MPRGDGTGPLGRGSMTGRGMGYCAGFDAPGYANSARVGGRMRGRCFGFGRGMGYAWGASMPLAYQEEEPQLDKRLSDLECKIDELSGIIKALRENK